MLSTRIAPLDSSAMQAGYSPADAQDPCSRICRVTTDCSGNSILGVMLPIRVVAPEAIERSSAGKEDLKRAG